MVNSGEWCGGLRSSAWSAVYSSPPRSLSAVEVSVCPSVFSVVNSGGGGLSRFKIEAWNRHQIPDPDQDGDLSLD